MMTLAANCSSAERGITSRTFIIVCISMAVVKSPCRIRTLDMHCIRNVCSFLSSDDCVLMAAGMLEMTSSGKYVRDVVSNDMIEFETSSLNFSRFGVALSDDDIYAILVCLDAKRNVIQIILRCDSSLIGEWAGQTSYSPSCKVEFTGTGLRAMMGSTVLREIKIMHCTDSILSVVTKVLLTTPNLRRLYVDRRLLKTWEARASGTDLNRLIRVTLDCLHHTREVSCDDLSCLSLGEERRITRRSLGLVFECAECFTKQHRICACFSNTRGFGECGHCGLTFCMKCEPYIKESNGCTVCTEGVRYRWLFMETRW